MEAKNRGRRGGGVGRGFRETRPLPLHYHRLVPCLNSPLPLPPPLPPNPHNHTEADERECLEGGGRKGLLKEGKRANGIKTDGGGGYIG